MKLDQDEVEREQQHGGGEHLGDEETVEGGAATQEFVTRQSVTGGGSESDTGEGCTRVPGMYTDVMSKMRTDLEGCG